MTAGDADNKAAATSMSDEMRQTAATSGDDQTQPSALRKCAQPCWIEIELRNTDHHPAAGELYEVIDSAGAHHTGMLDVNGFAHVAVAPGACKVGFPRLDGRAWSAATR